MDIYKKLWDYLSKESYNIENEKIVKITELFNLISSGYILEQEFGTPKVIFKLKRNNNPYIDKNLEYYNIPDNIDITTQELLRSYNDAKYHLNISDLNVLINIISLIKIKDISVNIVNIEGEKKLIISKK